VRDDFCPVIFSLVLLPCCCHAAAVLLPYRYHFVDRCSHKLMTEDEISFEMINDDYNKTKDQLDSIRARKTKFVCINDNMDGMLVILILAISTIIWTVC
jgi:hypothetical protein